MLHSVATQKIYNSGKNHTNFVSSLHKEIKLRNAESWKFKKNQNNKP